MNHITEYEFKDSLPKSQRSKVTPEIMQLLNDAVNDPEASEQLKENLVSYNHVLKEGKFSVEEYINAVKYNSFKAMGMSNKEAYIKTFQQKYANFKMLNVTDKVISRYIHAYNASKLVNLIRRDAAIPTHILNQDVFQEAINTQATIMRDVDVSPKVRSEAANSLLTHLKSPEAAKVELDITVNDSDHIKDLKQITMELAAQQKRMIDSETHSAKDIAHQRIIDVTPEED